MAKIVKNIFCNFLLFCFVFLIITGWLFSGWPQFYNFPPKVQEARAATISNSTPGTVASVADAGTGCTNATATDWGTMTNTTMDDAAYAIYGTGNFFDASEVSEEFQLSNFGIAIPDGSTINGITVDVNRKGTSADIQDRNINLTKTAGVQLGTNKAVAADWGTTDGTATYGSGSDVWGTTWSEAEVEASGFGLVVCVQTLAGDANGIASIDYINITVTYTPPVDTPVYDNGTATYNNDVSVTITVASPASAVICYTTNGDTPAATTPGTCSTGSTYSGAVSITATGTVLKAIGTKVGYPNSAVQSATYTLTVGAITSSPGAGTYGSTQSVTLGIATTTGAAAHYTTDGSAVSCASTTYSGAFDVAATSTVKAIGCKTNYVSDAPISDLYTINLNTVPSFSGNPTDSPDPVVTGHDVTFSGTATDSADNWYLAVCKTNVINPGSPPTCDTSQTYCVSSSAVASASQNTCTWTSTGTTAQNWYAFACDNNASPLCSSANSVNSPITVNSAVISVTVDPSSTDYGIIPVNAVKKANTANANDEFVVTNNSTNVAEDFDIVGSD
ncbi:MAG: chitobiase/beta-hexosaminidase C-terminal domain-containing protein, partial [Patescibacteria group bacterium]